MTCEKVYKSAKAIMAAARPLDRESIHVPEWDTDVLVRELSAAEADEIQRVAHNAFDEDHNLTVNIWNTARTVLFGAINPDGSPLFEGEKDLAFLASQPKRVLKPLAHAIDRLSGLTPEATGDAEKNSEATESGLSDCL